MFRGGGESDETAHAQRGLHSREMKAIDYVVFSCSL